MKNKKIIIWDLETSPIKAYTWGLWNSNIMHDYVIDPWNILCCSWKELGEKKVHSVSVFDKESNNRNFDYRNDLEVCKKIREVINSADILVAHNGDRFDLKMFNTRLIYHGLDPISPYTLTVDTMKEARKILKAPSTSMDFLCRYFGVGKKIRTDKYLWLDIISDESSIKTKDRTMKKMVDYCEGDIKVNEKLYLKLLPYMKSHPNLASGGTMNCPKCNSDKCVKNGIKKNKSGVSRQEMICKNCGSYFSSRSSMSDIPKSLSKL